MAVTGVKRLGRLAHLTLYLKDRWRCLNDLQSAIEAAEEAGQVVSGERDLLGELQSLLEQANDSLSDIERGESDTATSVEEHLSAIETITDDVRWDVSDDAAAQILDRVAKLAEQAASQKVRTDNYQARISEWHKLREDLAAAVENANKVYAPVGNEKRILDKLKALVNGADRALAARDNDSVEDALKKLDKLKDESGDLAAIAKKVEEKLPDAKMLSRQADLLLIRSDLANNRYQYTLLLRTPREPGTPGIDIQDESTMVVEDHKFFEDAMNEITAQINNGLVRSFKPPAPVTTDGAAGTPAGAPPAPPPDGLVAAVGVTAPVPAAPPQPAPPAGEAQAQAVGGNGAAAGAAPAAPGSVNTNEDVLRLRLVNAPPAQVNQTAADLVQDIGDLLYRLVVPETMQRFLTETKSSLTIRTNDVELPWELIARPDAGRPRVPLPRAACRPHAHRPGFPPPGDKERPHR